MFSGTARRERTSAYSVSKDYKLCGSQLPPVISSSGHEMTVLLVSDSTVSSRGFKARWDSLQDGDCGGRLGESGVLRPPVVGGNYTDNTWCSWTFLNPSPVNSTLVLSAPSYAMEAASSGSCRYDWLEVGDNPRQCGQSQSEYVVASPLPQTRILFRTDGSITDSGFNLTYSVSPCGGVLAGPRAVITSPHYPANYPDNLNCYWLLTFSPGSQIEITAAAFSLDSDCEADNVTVRNGGSPDSPVLWSGCGETSPPSLLSQSHQVSIQFVSDRPPAEQQRGLQHHRPGAHGRLWRPAPRSHWHRELPQGGGNNI